MSPNFHQPCWDHKGTWIDKAFDALNNERPATAALIAQRLRSSLEVLENEGKEDERVLASYKRGLSSLDTSLWISGGPVPPVKLPDMRKRYSNQQITELLNCMVKDYLDGLAIPHLDIDGFFLSNVLQTLGGLVGLVNEELQIQIRATLLAGISAAAVAYPEKFEDSPEIYNFSCSGTEKIKGELEELLKLDTPSTSSEQMIYEGDLGRRADGSLNPNRPLEPKITAKSVIKLVPLPLNSTQPFTPADWDYWTQRVLENPKIFEDGEFKGKALVDCILAPMLWLQLVIRYAVEKFRN